MNVPNVVLEPRNKTIGDLINACARGELAFSGSGSLCEKVSAMGYRIESLHEMVRAAEAQIARATRRLA